MESKDIALCIMYHVHDKNTLYNMSLVCKSYNRAFQKIKEIKIKEFGVDLTHFHLFKELKNEISKDQKKVQKVIDKTNQYYTNKIINFVKKFTSNMDKPFYRNYIKVRPYKFPETYKIDRIKLFMSFRNVMEEYLLKVFINNRKKKSHIDDMCTLFFINNKADDTKKHIILVTIDPSNTSCASRYIYMEHINVSRFQEYLISFATNMLKKQKRKSRIQVKGCIWRYAIKDIIPIEIYKYVDIKYEYEEIQIKLR